MRKIISIVCFFCVITATAQIKAEIDSVEILIGQQAHMTLSANIKQQQKVTFPNLKIGEEVKEGVEIVEINPVDTQKIDDNWLRVSQTYTITSFDEKLYAIDSLHMRIDSKDYLVPTMALKVKTVEVDTTNMQKFYPPKDVQDLPFEWKEWRTLFYLSLLALACFVAALYLRNKLKQNKPVIRRRASVKRLPSHEKALGKIQQIKAEHLQTSEDQKLYYTQLTEILRDYISERFGFNAKEMTSAEIIDALHANESPNKIDELHELLQTADLVKFAKYSTLLDERDRNLIEAVNFINENKIEQTSQPIIEEPVLTSDEKATQQKRRLLRFSIIAFAVAAVLIIGYIAYQIYQIIG